MAGHAVRVAADPPPVAAAETQQGSRQLCAAILKDELPIHHGGLGGGQRVGRAGEEGGGSASGGRLAAAAAASAACNINTTTLARLCNSVQGAGMELPRWNLSCQQPSLGCRPPAAAPRLCCGAGEGQWARSRGPPACLACPPQFERPSRTAGSEALGSDRGSEAGQGQSKGVGRRVGLKVKPPPPNAATHAAPCAPHRRPASPNAGTFCSHNYATWTCGSCVVLNV